jgi:uncharacterized protein YkwD
VSDPRSSIALVAIVTCAAWIVPVHTAAAPFAQQPGAHLADDFDIDALAEAHNRVRAESKLPPLKPSRALVLAAEDHARDMAAHFRSQHEGSDGSDPFTRIKRRGYKYESAGENVADGQTSIAEVMGVWINSPAHRKNILSDYTEIGAAVARDANGHTYWCVELARPWPELDPAKTRVALVAALNKARREARRPKLTEDRELQRVAQAFARESAAAAKFVNTDRAGRAPFDVLTKQGYRARQFAYSFASGQRGPEEVVRWWLDRKDDRAVLLSGSNRVGAGVAVAADGTPYWMLVMAQR